MKDAMDIREIVDKLDVLSEIYDELGGRPYPTREERDIARLKMELIKKEMLLMCYMLETKAHEIAP